MKLDPTTALPVFEPEDLLIDLPNAEAFFEADKTEDGYEKFMAEQMNTILHAFLKKNLPTVYQRPYSPYWLHLKRPPNKGKSNARGKSPYTGIAYLVGYRKLTEEEK